MKKTVRVLEDKTEYQENQSKRNNLIFTGLTEENGKEAWEESRIAIWSFEISFPSFEAWKLDMELNEIERAHRLKAKKDADL